MPISVKPVHRDLGAEIRGVDRREGLDDSAFHGIREAFHRYSVLVFPDQAICDDQQVAFSRRFGDLEAVDFKAAGALGNPNVYELCNTDRDGNVLPRKSEKMQFMAVNERWHTDSSFKAVPATASLLSARRVPEEGGDTCFASMRVAYDELSEDDKQRLGRLTAIHSYAYSRSLFDDRGAPKEEVDALPPAVHPIVRSHEPTGKKSLYVSGHIREIIGMSVSEGRALVDELIASITRTEKVYRHRWRIHDLVMWDNRCVLHRAMGFPEADARIMHRTTVAGDGPVVP